MKQYTLFSIFIVVFLSCENSKNRIVDFIELENLAVEEVKNSQILYTEYGHLRVKVISRNMRRFLQEEDIVNLSGGVVVKFYKSDTINAQSILTCERAIINNTTNLMIANENVILSGSNNKRLSSEQLIWDKSKDIIYTDFEVIIRTEDEVIFGSGFESTSDFSEYEIKRARGSFGLEKD